MTQVTWILDSNILEHLTRKGNLPAAIEAAGHKVRSVDYKVGFPHQNYRFAGPVVLYGSHSFVKEMTKIGHYQPGGLGVNDRTQASQYMSHLPLNWFLNRDAVFMTWAMFKHRIDDLWYEHETKPLFIRPNSGFKTFAGQVIYYEDPQGLIKTLDEASSVVAETMIMVNPAQEIGGEFRFVIADGKVIAGSEYRWDGKLDIRRDWPPECEAMAAQVAQHEWQVDVAYTCDVALTDDGPKVVELNGFSCAGLYACDLNLVAKGVSEAAYNEWAGVFI